MGTGDGTGAVVTVVLVGSVLLSLFKGVLSLLSPRSSLWAYMLHLVRLALPVYLSIDLAIPGDASTSCRVPLAT